MAEVRPTGPRAAAGTAALYGVLVVAAILFLVPFYLLVRNGLSTDLEISAPDWKLWPSSLQFSNVTDLFDNRSVPFLRSLRNSAIVVGAADDGRRARRVDGRATAWPASRTASPRSCS